MIFWCQINEGITIMTFVINIIGAGNLGKTLGHLLVKHQLVRVNGICNTSELSSLKAIEFIGEGNYYPTIAALPEADITFITVPDDLIPKACEELTKNPFLKPGSIVIHCSGSLNSDLLLTLKNRGCFIASIHPMHSFAKPELSVVRYKGSYCAFEGDPEATSLIAELFNGIGSVSYPISKDKKSLYHAAGVMASNYLVTLAQQALLCMEEADVDNEMAMQVITNIMKGTLSNLENTKSPKQALTGPIRRGDRSTIEKHMEAFTADEQRDVYAILGKATLQLTNHEPEIKEQIKEALQLTEPEQKPNLFF